MGLTYRILVLIITGLLTACAGTPDDDYETRDWSAEQFYLEASDAMADGEYQTAIKYYEGLEARYPYGRYAMQAQLDVAYAYYKYEEPDSAIAAADRFIKLHPSNPYVDYAYYLKGIVNFNRSIGLIDRFIPTDAAQRDPGSALDSFNDFATLVKKFPDSRYAEDARQRLIYLRDNLANSEIHVARYYMNRGAYLAAINRAKYVIENYQRTTAVKPGLEILVEAYNRLGMDDMAADAKRVLDINQGKDRLVENRITQEDKSWGRRFWEFLGLDQN